MEYHSGDLILVKPGTHVPPGSRYSSGIIIKSYEDPMFPRGTPEIFLDILWVDGHQSTQSIRLVKPYYELIHP